MSSVGTSHSSKLFPTLAQGAGPEKAVCVPCTLLPKGWQNAGPLPWRPELPTGQAHSPPSRLSPRTAQVSQSGPLPSGTLPDASLLTCPASPDSALCPGYFPLNSSLQARVSPPHPSWDRGVSSPSQTSNVSRPFFLLPFSSSHSKHPHPTTLPRSLSSSPAPLGSRPRLPRTWGKGRASPPGGCRAAGQRPLAAGEKSSA